MKPLRTDVLAVAGALVLFFDSAWSDVLTAADAAPRADPFAQPAPPGLAAVAGAEGGQPAEGQRVFAPPDRNTLRLLTSAQQLIQQNRYAEAVRCLGAILESPQDYFYRPDNRTLSDSAPRSLKSEAQRLLGTLSERGRALYELQYGVRARQMLDEAAAAGDAAGLAEVSRRFFHTQAGYEATLLLGLDQLDRGEPLGGALALERLRATAAADAFEPGLSLTTAVCWLRAGRPEEASRALAALKQRYPEATIQVAGEEVPLFAGRSDVLGWLSNLVAAEAASAAEEPRQWAMFRGDAARSAPGAAGGPLLSPRWRVPASDHPYLEAMIEQVRQADQEWDRWTLPALHALVVDDLVLMRTARNLLAVDLATGKRLWESPVADPFEPLLNFPQEFLQRRTPQLEYALRLRMWGDAAYGKLTSDGRCVFAVEDLGLELGPMQFHSVFAAGRPSLDGTGPKPYNRLTAYEIARAGKLKWHVGGSPDEFGLPLAGTFFLGPPLPLMGRLYVLAETMGEIRLMALDAGTGTLLWSQQLAATDQTLVKDPLRRMAGDSPSYADGVLVCPTSNRSIVAIDLATRSLLWGYAYPQSDSRAQRQVLFLGPRSITDPDPAGRWIDSTVVLAEGRVLATPVDSDELHCLNLTDGKLVWKEPRGDDLYLACVHRGKVVLVGSGGVRAVDLEKTRRPAPSDSLPGARPGPPDRAGLKSSEARPNVPPQMPPPAPANPSIPPPEPGGAADEAAPRPAPAWEGRVVDLPEGAHPSGIGFRGGDLYYLPLSSGEVMAVDLLAGRAATVYRSRDGSPLGNLVCCRGRVISQEATAVEAFDQLEPLRNEVDRRLAATPDDAEALALRGEILWDQGDLEQAIGCLRRSFQLDPDPSTRELLRDAMFDGFRRQFATVRRHAAEIERLIDRPDERATYLGLMAVGLAQAGELSSAWEHYLKLIDLDVEHRGMEAADHSHSVRRDRWIQVQLAALWQSAPAPTQAAMDEAAAARLRAVLSKESPEELQRFLEYFGALPLAEEARRRLAAQWAKSGNLLAAELLIQRGVRSPDPGVRGPAVAELAEMFRQAGRARDAAVCYARLQHELADVVCAGSRTGRELAESLPADDPVRALVQPAEAWPKGEVIVAKGKPQVPPEPTYNQVPLMFEGDRGPFFSDVIVELHQDPAPKLVARDGFGNRQWQLPLAELSRDGDFLFSRGMTRVVACGHLLLVSSGQRILAIDTLGTTNEAAPRLLWTHQWDEPELDPTGRDRLNVQLANLAGGMPQIELAAYADEPMNVPRVLSEEILCFKRSRNCVAVELRTGKTLWVRQNVPRGAELFGDHQYVFLVRPGETAATVLRAADGSIAGKREVPLERERAYGRHVLVWRESEGRRVLEMVDPWENRHLWPPREFSDDAVLRPMERAAAIYEPSGRFVLLDLADGRAVIDARLQPPQGLSQLLVLERPEQVIVIFYDRGPSADQARRAFAMHGVASERIDRGQVYAFDRQGKQLWPAPVLVEDQWLPLSQPARLPVLTLASMVQERGPNTRTRAKTAVVCLDRRDGRVVCREELPAASNTFQLVGDPDKKTVEVRLQQNTLSMTFTDHPPSPKPGTDRSASHSEAGGSATARALFKAIEAAISGTPSKSNQP